MLTRRESIAAAVALATGLPARAAQKPALAISSFTTEITPPIGHPCMGGGVAPVKEILDPLLAHGFILQGVGEPIAFVALDWCEVRNGAFDLFRTRIAKAIGSVPQRVMLCSLHQHDTPIMDVEAQQILEKHAAKGKICDLEFLHKTVVRVADDARAALKTSQPVTHLGTGEARVEKVSSNRRYLDAAGKVLYNRMSATRDEKIREAEEGTIDPLLKTLSFWQGDKPLVALSAYAVHPMSFYGRGGVTADFVGLARKQRQAATPGTLQIYASGCSGNVTAGKFNDGSPANRPILADRIHTAMTAAWQSTKKTPITSAAFRSVPLLLEPRSSKGFSDAELLERVKNDPRPFGQCLGAFGLSWKQRCDAGKPIDLPVLDFGSAAITLLPAESYVEFQLEAQKLRPGDFILVAGYGECGPGYIPIERAWKENDGNLHDWSWINPGSEPRMLEAIQKALKT